MIFNLHFNRKYWHEVHFKPFTKWNDYWYAYRPPREFHFGDNRRKGKLDWYCNFYLLLLLLFISKIVSSKSKKKFRIGKIGLVTEKSQPKAKKMDERFYHIIPNVTSNLKKISVDTMGKVDAYFLKKVETIDERSLCKVPYTKFLHQNFWRFILESAAISIQYCYYWRILQRFRVFRVETSLAELKCSSMHSGTIGLHCIRHLTSVILLMLF
jgi:hypothetical protein